LRTHFRRVNPDIRHWRRLIGIGNPRKVGNLAGHSLLVEPLDIAFDKNLHRAVHIDFDEVRDTGSQLITARLIGRNRRRDGDDTVPREEFADEADAANVLPPVVAAKTETPAQLRSDYVTVDHFDTGAHRAQASSEQAR